MTLPVFFAVLFRAHRLWPAFRQQWNESAKHAPRGSEVRGATIFWSRADHVMEFFLWSWTSGRRLFVILFVAAWTSMLLVVVYGGLILVLGPTISCPVEGGGRVLEDWALGQPLPDGCLKEQ